MITKYRNRRDAGKVLAELLHDLANREDVLVLALPRGGVPVGFEIAQALHAPLDVFIVRKLGVPGQSELAMGAIAMGDAIVFNEDIIKQLNVSKDEFNSVVRKEEAELKRRDAVYRGNHAFPELKNKTIILVDDGIATGATMRAAIKSLKTLKAGSIIIAVPVAPKDVCEDFSLMVDRFICPLAPDNFNAVGNWYEEFPQTEDSEVHTLLKQAKKIYD